LGVSGSISTQLSEPNTKSKMQLVNTMMRIGRCPLCRRDGHELQDSHFQPAGVYRVLRDETESNPNPFRFSDEGVFQDSRQVSDYLLCRDCEQRLSKNGENWFLAHCWRKNQFRLASLLDSAIPPAVYPRMRIYHAAMIPGLNVTALTYFAASMFWRASVHRWEIARSKFRGIELGPYEEQLREYLMSESPFPDSCALLVSVPENVKIIAGLSLTPYGGRKGTHHAYKLVVLGVGFHLLIGRQIPRGLRAMCLVRGVGNPICRTDMLEQAIMQDLSLKFSQHPQLLDRPKGSASA
jgi:hypothetical protein